MGSATRVNQRAQRGITKERTYDTEQYRCCVGDYQQLGGFKIKRAGHKNLHSVDGQLVLGKGGDDGDEGSGDGEELHFVAETCGGTERYVKGSVGGEICKGGLGEKRGKGRRQAKRHLTGYGKALRGKYAMPRPPHTYTRGV